ncbi:HesA/MoeB/ThiF family protein [Kitasatospora sp. NPDC127060]|uniref:HesA/MoeB/ThiF family protein n=1 Tax=Kitasatospora sp. NPDC127060 TaxID=3347121 RepID=UPI00365415B3
MGHVRIGGGVYGIAAEIEDADGWIWQLVNVLDGSRSPDQVTAEVCDRCPEVTRGEVESALEQLIEGGYLVDAAAPPPAELSPRELERYARSMQYYRWTDLTPRRSEWDVQSILKHARVAVVGVGGAGGAAALSLAASGVGHIHCVDADTVELSNLNRQTLYTEDDIGKPKADAAAARLRRLNSDITVTSRRLRIEDERDFGPVLVNTDLLVLGADRPPAIRIWANRACLAAGTAWVDGGYHGAHITVGGYTPGNGPCWECLRAGDNAEERLPVASMDDLVKALPKAPGHPVTAVTAGLSGQLMAHWAIALLTGAAPVTPGTVYGVNLMVPGDPVSVHHPRRPGCPACGATG